MNKKYLILIVLLWAKLYAQSNTPLPQSQNLPFNATTAVQTSDYGPRYLSTTQPYDWHGGIDFSTAIGTPIYPVEPGEIYFIKATGLKAVCVFVDDGQQIP